MKDEERTRVEVLLDNLQTSVNVIAEAQGASVERLDRMDSRFDKLETKFDRLEMRFDRLEMRFDGLEMRFEVFAGDTQQRLKRIEGHLELNGSSRLGPRRKVMRTSPLKRRKKA